MRTALIILMQAGAGGTTASGGGSTAIAWGLVLLGAALLLGFVEVFVPSGGVIGIVALLAAIAGVGMLAWADPALGLAAAAALVVVAPVLTLFALKVWPHTPVGRLLMLRDRQDAGAEAADDDGVPRSRDGVKLGTRGVAISMLRPMGTCMLGDRRVECTARDGLIEPDTPVEVVDVDGWRVFVAEAAKAEASEPATPPAGGAAGAEA